MQREVLKDGASRNGDQYFGRTRVLDSRHGYLRGLELTRVARPLMANAPQRTGQTVSWWSATVLRLFASQSSEPSKILGFRGKSVRAIRPMQPLPARSCSRTLM